MTAKRTRTHLILLALVTAIVAGSHAPFLRLPFFWDELGQFVPAALDIYREGLWVPRSTTPNVHPPGVMAYLAAAWSVAGYSILSTRLAMLLLAGAGAYVSFLLAIRLTQGVPGAPAFSAVVFLILSPVFYTQAMMAQLDMPAMLFTALALLLFLDRRYAWSAAVCCILVITKETGLVAPAVFGLWMLARERDVRRALLFVLPIVPLTGWLVYLRGATGHVLGDSGFAHYNVSYALHPVRVAVALQRRLYFLFVQSFHWVGAIAMLRAWIQTKLFRRREWEIAGWLAGAHVLAVSVLGGATLERYLVPILPILYAGMAASLCLAPTFWRVAGQITLACGLLFALFLNPLHPFPYENNLAMVDFVNLHQQAAGYLEQNFANVKVATAWPLTAALRNPEFGFVEIPFETFETSDFHAASIAAIDPRVRVLVLYSRTWEPEAGLLSIPWVRSLLQQYYDYEPAAKGRDTAYRLGFRPMIEFRERGQWVEVLVKM